MRTGHGYNAASVLYDRGPAAQCASLRGAANSHNMSIRAGKHALQLILGRVAHPSPVAHAEAYVDASVAKGRCEQLVPVSVTRVQAVRVTSG